MLDFTNENAWDFEVEERRFIPEGLSIPVEGWKALVRPDTGETLHVHRDSYKKLPHSDVVNSTYDSIKSANISQDFDFKVNCIDSGRKLQIDILFNDLVTEPVVGDHIKYRIRAWNSYDGSWSYQTIADAFRLWCKNGCTTADPLSKTRMKHTSQINIDGSAEKIVRGLETFHTNKELWQSWMQTDVLRDRCEKFFKTHLVSMRTKTSEVKHNFKQLEALMGQLDAEFFALGKNKWALYNCMTHWATHTTDSKSPLNVTREREDRVAKAISSQTWLAI